MGGHGLLVLTFLRDDYLTQGEGSFLTLPEPDDHITPSLTTALTLKLLLAPEFLVLIGTDLVGCERVRWRGVSHSDVKIV